MDKERLASGHERLASGVRRLASDSREQVLQDLRDHLLIDQDLGLEFLDPTVAMPAPQGAALSVSAPTGPTTTPDTAALPTPDVKRLEPDAAALPTPDARRQTPDVSLPLPAAELAAVAAQVAACRACGLCQTRTTTVPGEGNPGAELVFVGEGPGADEDAQGRPFVGKAGELLTAMIQAMGFSREEVYIANVVKCRPPGNRTPEPGEVAACLPYLDRQLLAIRPKIIVALGNTPLRALTGDDKLGITAHRGKMLAWRGIPLLPTFHPAYLLRNPPAKKPCWEDLKAVVQFLGRELPKRG